jgi:hypothetical protein
MSKMWLIRKIDEVETELKYLKAILKMLEENVIFNLILMILMIAL